MSIPFFSNVDLNKNEIQNSVLQVLASAPSSPATGQQYYDSTLGAPRWYNGSAWINKATDSLLLQGQNSAYHLSRSNHSGTQLANTISDFDSQVRTSRLDQMAAPTGSVGFNSQKATGLANGTTSGDAVTCDQLTTASAKRHSADVGDGSATDIDITHNLGTRDVVVQVRRVASPYDQIFCGVEMKTTNIVTLKFAVAPTSGQFRVTVLG